MPWDTEVSPRTLATPAPSDMSANSGINKFVIPYTTANVPTTFSFAIKPVIDAAANCHAPNPNGINKIAKAMI